MGVQIIAIGILGENFKSYGMKMSSNATLSKIVIQVIFRTVIGSTVIQKIFGKKFL